MCGSNSDSHVWRWWEINLQEQQKRRRGARHLFLSLQQKISSAYSQSENNANCHYYNRTRNWFAKERLQNLLQNILGKTKPLITLRLERADCVSARKFACFTMLNHKTMGLEELNIFISSPKINSKSYRFPKKVINANFSLLFCFTFSQLNFCSRKVKVSLCICRTSLRRL